MGFFQFLRKIKNRRFIVPSLIVLSVLVFGGTVLGLAKTGKLAIFADTVVKTTQSVITQNYGTGYGSVHITVDPSNTGGGAAFFQNGQAVSAPGSFTGNVYNIPSLALGQYQYQFGMPGPNGQPCMGQLRSLNHAWSSTVDTYPKFTCGTPPVTGTYSISGFVSFSDNPSSKPPATISFDGDTSKYTVSASGGSYTLSGLPYDPAQMANHAFTFSSIGYTTRSGLRLQGDLFQNPYGIQSGGTFYNVNVRLVVDLPEYKFTGSVLGDGGAALSGVTVDLVDKNLAANQIIRTEQSKSAGTYANGKNYLIPDNTAPIMRANLNNLFLRFTPANTSGYQATEINLTDTGVIINTSMVGSGSSIYELKTIKNVTLARSALDLYYKVSITDPACTSALCPNRNAAGMVSGIPLVIAGQSDIQISSNTFTPSSLSGKFSAVTAGPRTLYVNPSSNTANYNQAYLTETISNLDVATTPTQTITGLGTVHVLQINLRRNSSYQPQAQTFDLQGLLKDKTGQPIIAGLTVSCENDPDCGSYFITPSPQQSAAALINPKPNNSDANYIFKDLKNPAFTNSPISELTLRISKPGFYVDNDNNGLKDPGEDGVISVKASDIRAVSGKSVCEKSYTLRSITESEVRITGTVKNTSGQPITAQVKLFEVQSDGSLPTSPVTTVTNDTRTGHSGEYSMTDLRRLISPTKDYMLVADPQGAYSNEMVSVRFSFTPVLVIDFRLGPNPGSVYTITGYVQNIDATGSIQNLTPADVTAAIDGNWSTGYVDDVIFSTTTKPDTLQYTITLSVKDVFGDGPNPPASKTIVLTGFNGYSWSATKHKSYKITLTRGEGALIHRDFQFYSGDLNDPSVLTKNVKITLTQQTKEYRAVSSGSEPILQSSGSAAPLPGVMVQLKSRRAPNTTGQSGYTVASESRATGADGAVIFTGYPRLQAQIIISGLPKELIPEGGENSLILAANPPSGSTWQYKTINYYKLPWDPNALKNTQDKIVMQQCGNGQLDHTNVYYPASDDGDGHFEICEAGCCITSIAMAAKFYYPDKQFKVDANSPGRPMSPFYIGDLSMRYSLNGGFGSWGGLVDKINSVNGTDYHLEDLGTSLDLARQYLRRGIPVILHVSVSGGMHGHRSEHCVLLTSFDAKSGLYGIIDPNSGGASPTQYWPSSYFGPNIDTIQALTTTASKNYFSSVRGKVSSNNVAFAADANDHARTDSDYLVTANIRSDTAAQVQQVLLKLKRTGLADVYLRMDKSGQDFSYLIPKHLISDNFSYQFVAINTFNAQIESPDYLAIVDKVYSPTITLSRAFSALRFNIYNYRNRANLTVIALDTYIKAFYQSFRNAFTTFLSRMGINQSDLVPISGQIVNASGQRMPKVIIKIWEDAALSEDGTFTVSNVQRGRVAVEVIDQMTNRNYLVINPSIDVVGPVSNLRVVVDDPNDTGSFNAWVFWESTQNAQMTAANALKSGTIQIIRNGQVEKTINLATVGGRINIPQLQVGSHNIKYLMPDGTEKKIWLYGQMTNNTPFNIVRGQTTNEIIRVDDGVVFNIKFVGSLPYGNCNYWNPEWGGRPHLYILSPNSSEYDAGGLPTNCTITIGHPEYGRFSFRLFDKNGYNSAISPTYIDVPAATNGVTYEIRIL